MKPWKFPRSVLFGVMLAAAGLCAGCGTVGGVASDLGLAGLGGVAGYELADGKVGGAAAGAAVGYLGSRIAQSEIRQAMEAAEKRGYDRAMNQSAKQQYWIIQNQQRSREDIPSTSPRHIPIVIPETKIDGVIQDSRVEYLRVAP